MSGFDEAWTVVAVPRDGEAVSPRPRHLLQSVYKDCLSEPLNLVGLKSSLEDLLEFLSGDGRTRHCLLWVELWVGKSVAKMCLHWGFPQPWRLSVKSSAQIAAGFWSWTFHTLQRGGGGLLNLPALFVLTTFHLF